MAGYAPSCRERRLTVADKLFPKEVSLEKLLMNYAADRRYELTARALKRAKEIRKKEADGTPDLQDLIQIALREVLEEDAKKKDD